MIKSIEVSKCEICDLRLQDTCPVMESCFQDVIRLDAMKKPFIAYPEDCCGCWANNFACQADCPAGAVTISTGKHLEYLPF